MRKELKVAAAGNTTPKSMGKGATSSAASAKTPSAIHPQVNKQVNKIMCALNEANEISSGKRKRTSFDDFLKEL